MREPMFLPLVACGAIYLIVGDMQEALMLLAFVFFVMGITLYQEGKTERALEALRDLSSPRAMVIRDGTQQRIAGREVVRGDIILLAEGDRVPADALVMECTSLSTDESLLTGESVAVRKVCGNASSPAVQPGGDDLPFVFSGTLVVRGQGIARAVATGQQSAIGKIGKALQTVTSEETLLQRETGRLVRVPAITVLGLCALLIFVYGITRGTWLDGVLAGLTLAMAIMPNELPVVLTIFLALGHGDFLEPMFLPAAHLLWNTWFSNCSLRGQDRHLDDEPYDGHWCSTQTGFFATSVNSARIRLRTNFTIWWNSASLAVSVIPLIPWSGQSRNSARIGLTPSIFTAIGALRKNTPYLRNFLPCPMSGKAPEGMDYVIAAKGAPEAVADICHFSDSQLEEMMSVVTRMADDGLRVLGVARSYFREAGLPSQQHDFTFEFLGLVGLADPVRPTVAPALQDCYRAGIRMVMITGDYPGTARSIARQIGLVQRDEVITGPELGHHER